jgi:hypothetical protein
MSDPTMSADGHLRRALDLLRQEETQRVETFNRELAELRQKIAAIEAVIAPAANKPQLALLPITATSFPRSAQVAVGTPEPMMVPRSTPTADTARLARLVKGRPQTEALIAIAEANDGILRTAEAKQILMQAGLIHGNPKNASSHLFALLRNQERWSKYECWFQRISPGVFKLVPKGEHEKPVDQAASAGAVNPLDALAAESRRVMM